MNNAPAPNQGRKLFYGLFVFPLIILMGMIVMVCAVVLLTHESDSPESLIAGIKTGSARSRWQKASELSNELNRRPAGIRDRALLNEMISILQDRARYDAKTRAYMTQAISRFDLPEARETLRQALGDSDTDVQFYALWALGSLGDKAAVPQILPFLKSDREDLRVNAAYVLGALGDPQAVPALRPLLGDSSTDVRWNTALALARLGDGSGLAVLTGMLDRESLRRMHQLDDARIEELMTSAIKGLALIHRPESIKILESLSKEDQSLKVRQAAMDAIQFQKQQPAAKV